MADSALAFASFPSCSCSDRFSKPNTIPIVSSATRMKLSSSPKSGANKGLLNLGVGFLAASILSLTPLESDATRVEYYATVNEPSCEINFVRSGLGYCDVIVGSGAEAPRAELVNIHYTARFADGTVFDSSYKQGMRIGVGKVIRGLDQGILRGEGVPPILTGGHRKLWIPPSLAYGPEPAGCFLGDCNVPGNATLLYDIKFVGIYSGNRKLEILFLILLVRTSRTLEPPSSYDDWLVLDGVHYI